ncbi:hypothetical protein [Paenibacillus dokdonensis]|uniref:hypothetical protein n=1 Tax=Paenibacillus dokdonensis TaxID=2567944 RepID=UPI0010A76DE9|nr:hypothetical protein [Paenibacillus dokdonensis]
MQYAPRYGLFKKHSFHKFLIAEHLTNHVALAHCNVTVLFKKENDYENALNGFEEAGDFLHTTSLLRYPVFVEKRNYTGTNPETLSSPLLRQQVCSTCEELEQLQDVLIIPLGKAVERVLRWFPEQGRIREQQVLWGFPHPSGANGHKHRQFEEHKELMRHTLSLFFGDRQ